MGELHLEILVDRMQREFNVVATVGKPQVAYRETITKKVETVEYRHIKQSGGSGQFAVVKIDMEPNPGKGYEFVDKISGGRIPREYINPTNQGLQSALDNGVLAGYPTRLRNEHEIEVEVTKGQGLNDAFAQLSAQSLHVASMRTKTNRLEELFIRLVQDKDKEERRSA